MIKAFFVTLPLTLFCDFVWLGFVVKEFNLRELAPIARIQDGQFQLLLGPAVIAYILMAASLTMFSIPRAVAASSGIKAFGWGSALGLFIYGVYDMTNLALIKDYSLAFAMADMSWGTFLYGLITWVVGYLWLRPSGHS